MDTVVELEILVLHSVTGREADVFATKNSVDTAAGLKNLALQEVSRHIMCYQNPTLVKAS
jgi:hypothetical protein